MYDFLIFERMKLVLAPEDVDRRIRETAAMIGIEDDGSTVNELMLKVATISYRQATVDCAKIMTAGHA